MLHTDYRRPYSTYHDAFDAARALFFFSITWGFCITLYIEIYLHKHRRIVLAVATLSAICTWPLAAARPTARTAAYRYYSCCFPVCDRGAAQRGSWFRGGGYVVSPPSGR